MASDREPSPSPPSERQWTDLIVRARIAGAARKEADELQRMTKWLEELSIAARDLAWEMRVQDCPLVAALPSESEPIVARFRRTFGRLFANGGFRFRGGVTDSLVARMLTLPWSAPLEGGRFDVSTADAKRIEGFGLAIGRMLRYVGALPRLEEKRARSLRGGGRGKLPSTAMAVVLDFMKAHGLKPRETAERLVETVARLRRAGVGPSGKPDAFLLDPGEWGPADEDPADAVARWEHRLGQALYERRRVQKPRQRRKRDRAIKK